MLKEREELETLLQKELKHKASDKSLVNKLIQSLIVSGIPEKNAGEIILLIKPLSNYNDRTLYKISSLLLTSKVVNSFFTPKEIKEYGKTTKTTGKNIFPIRWNMVQIGENQFIGKITCQELMRLRDMQLLNYNPEAQRPMKSIYCEGKELLVPTLNSKAVKQIAQSYLDSTYIPNTITLNIPIENSFEYDNGNNELIIYQLEHFDILDGYHRYRAMSDIYNLDGSFDYPMELRIVSFSDEEAKQFIYQEDQKTKMKKIDSDSFNQKSHANQIIQELNKFSTVLKGKFDAKKYIDSALAGRMIDITFLHGVKNINRKEVLDIKNYIEQCFREYESYNINFLDSKWEPRFTIAFFYSIWKTQELGIERLIELVKIANDIVGQDNKYHSISFRRVDLLKLDKEVCNYV